MQGYIILRRKKENEIDSIDDLTSETAKEIANSINDFHIKDLINIFHDSYEARYSVDEALKTNLYDTNSDLMLYGNLINKLKRTAIFHFELAKRKEIIIKKGHFFEAHLIPDHLVESDVYNFGSYCLNQTHKLRDRYSVFVNQLMNKTEKQYELNFKN